MIIVFWPEDGWSRYRIVARLHGFNQTRGWEEDLPGA